MQGSVNVPGVSYPKFDAAIKKLENDKLDASKLQESIDTALEQARKSGDFDGPQGPKGETGETGATGPQGPQGEKGDPGPIAYWVDGAGSTTAGTWIGTNENITEYYDGLIVAYKVGVAGASGGTTLNINGLGAVKIVRNITTAVTTHYGVGSVVILTYTVDSDGTAYWKIADYDSDTKARSSNKTGTKMYIIGAASQSTTGQTTYSNKNCYIGTDNCLYSGGKKVNTEGHTHAASEVTFTDGDTFQAKYDSGELTGPQGEKGDTGEQGPQGIQGETGATGPQGVTGKTAYEYAVEGGYEGTEEEFILKLAAENGVKSWNELEDKPVTVVGESDTLTWDGDISGKPYMQLLFGTAVAKAYKVSSVVPTYADVMNGFEITYIDSDGNKKTETITPEQAASSKWTVGTNDDGSMISLCLCFVYIAATEQVDEFGNVVSAGVYFYSDANDNLTATAIGLKINGYSKFPNGKIFPEYLYLPDWNAACDENGFVKNKPFYEETTYSDTVEWDGDIANRVLATINIDNTTNSYKVVHVSDVVPAFDKLSTALKTTTNASGALETLSCPISYLTVESDGAYYNDGKFIVIPHDGYITAGPYGTEFIFEKKGVYFLHNGSLFVKSVQFTNNFCFSRTTITTIQEKFIPDTIQRVGEDVIISSSTEGSTKKFKLTVDDSGTITATEVT